MRIRSRLLLLVFSLLIPSLFGAVLGIYYVYDEQQESYREGLQALTNTKALLLDKEMAERIATLQAVSRSTALKDGDLERFYDYAREVAANWDTVIVLSDEAGQQILNTRAPFGKKDLPRITPSLIAKRRELGPQASIVSDLYFAPIGNSHSFAVQVPVMRKGRVAYYLAMGSFSAQLQPLLEQQATPGHWVATILDHQGVVAARSHNPQKFVGVVADSVLRQKMALAPTGTNEGTTLDGTEVIAFFSRAPSSGWSFVVSLPREALRSSAREATIAAAAIALLLLGAGTAVAFLVASRTVKSMEDLRRAASGLGEGKTIAVKSSGVVEVDAVSLEMAQASEKIRGAKTELERRVAEAVSIAEQSQKALLHSQKLEALGRLTGGIAHDFNNLMQTLTTGLQLLLLSATEPKLKRTAQACQRAVERAAELTRQLMAFGRVQDVHITTVELQRLVEEITPLLQGALRGDIELRFDIAADLWPMNIDQTQLELALLNVVINARDAMPAGGSLVIRARNSPGSASGSQIAAGDHVRIDVCDSGQGMSQDVLNRATEPFFTTKPVGQGSGMGLAQAYGFARQAGGDLGIVSRVGEGTTISFHLPRARERIREAASPGTRGVPQTKKDQRRMLFVEDDQLVSAVVKPALVLAGFDVREARNGEQALSLLQQDGPFDVVFSDVVMPGKVSGIELAKHVADNMPSTRILLATGYSHARLAVPGIEIVSKPYDVQAVIESLNKD